VLYAVLILAVFAAAFTQGVAGFGTGMVSMAVLPLVMPLPDAVAVVSVVCLVVNFSILVQLRRHVTWERAGPLIAGAVVGVPLGLLALERFDPSILKITLGLILIGYAIQSARGPLQGRRTLAPAWGLAVGVAAGSLGGAFNCGGPISVIYVTLQSWSKDATKATLTAFFCAISTIQMPLYIGTGVLGRDHLPLIAAALPTLALGLWFGTKVYDSIDQAMFRRVMLVLIGVMGVVFLAREIV
jgi:uncharacterized membrane protein YfcA